MYITYLFICLYFFFFLIILENQLTTQCDEAEVHIKEHEGMLGKKPSPLAGIDLTTFQSPFDDSTHWAMGDSYSEQDVHLR